MNKKVVLFKRVGKGVVYTKKQVHANLRHVSKIFTFGFEKPDLVVVVIHFVVIP